jgi:YesN/AraC family two-component response regulator
MDSPDQNSLLYNLKVLYVEDEEFTREELSKYLKRRVGKLFVARNGQEGLDMFNNNRPDLVVTDLKMPGMDGIEMIKSIRNQGESCAAIIISALSDSDTILKAVDLGIVKYVVKPVNTRELIYTMEKLSSDILKNRLNQTVINESILVNKPQKQELEKKIKGEIAHFIKTNTGKGPRDIQVFIHGSNIEIKSYEVLTLLELNLVSGNRNNSLVDYTRKLFYTEKTNVLEEVIGTIVGSKVRVDNIKCDSLKNEDCIILSIF